MFLNKFSKTDNYFLEINHTSATEQITFDILPPDISLNDIAVLDIETTGLDPSSSVATILGMTDFDSNYNPRTRQIFLAKKEFEKEAFDLFYEMTRTKKFIITFNGDFFDIPYINKKFVQHNILNIMLSGLDVYKWGKKYQSSQVKIQKDAGIHEKSIIKPFGDRLTLKAIEKFVNIDREDSVHGVTMIEKYHLYEFCYKTSHSSTVDNEFEIRLSLSKDPNVYDIYRNNGEESVREYLLKEAFRLRDELLLHNREDTYNLLLLFSKITDKIYKQLV